MKLNGISAEPEIVLEKKKSSLAFAQNGKAIAIANETKEELWNLIRVCVCGMSMHHTIKIEMQTTNRMNGNQQANLSSYQYGRN